MYPLNSSSFGLGHLNSFGWFPKKVTMSGELERPPGMVESAKFNISISLMLPSGFGIVAESGDLFGLRFFFHSDIKKEFSLMS